MPNYNWITLNQEEEGAEIAPFREYFNEAYSISSTRTPEVRLGPEPEPRFRCELCTQDRTMSHRVANPDRYDRDRMYCDSCVFICAHCNGVRRAHWRHTVNGRSDICDSCSYNCGSCRERHMTHEMHYSGGVYYCTSCTIECRGCGSRRRRRGRCPECDTLRGVTGYGRTRADYWLGGPLPRNEKGRQDGYYLGFELEISAVKGNAERLRDWAETNLGYRDGLDCKMDSSVQGFEIATQPMTPQFFEKVDWEEFFALINSEFSLGRKRKEPVEHGLHVHIGRTAFDRDPFALAAFCHLIGQGGHLERIARRDPTYYCAKVEKPASAVIAKGHYDGSVGTKQSQRLYSAGNMSGRGAINLGPEATVEIRAFRSTRSPQDLKNAVRLVYVTAEYVRALRKGKAMVSPSALDWSAYARWVGQNYPDAFESIAGLDALKAKGKKFKHVDTGSGW